MAISKKIRFEVVKRDGFQCGYCGRTPPEVVLEVDHINPKSKGGKDDINNLITACFDCNRGKSNVQLTSVPKKLSENIVAIKEKEDQIKEYNKFLKKIENRIQKDIEEISSIYTEQYDFGDDGRWIFSDHFKQNTLRRFLKELPKQEIITSLNLATSKFPTDKDSVVKYFCGICWNKIRDRNPKHEIIRLWIEISKKCIGKVAKYDENDIDCLEKFSKEDLKSSMRHSFKYERSYGYWSFFLWLLREVD